MPSNNWKAAAIEEIADGECDHRSIGRRGNIDVGRKHQPRREQHHARTGHLEQQAGGQRRHARAADRTRIAGAIMKAHADRRCLRDAERDLEEQCGDLQRDGVGRKLGCADHAHQERRRAKKSALGDDDQRNRQADAQDLAQPLPFGLPPAPEQAGSGESRRPMVTTST